MSTITVHQLERDPAEFLRRVEGGESLLVLREGRVVAEVQPVAAKSVARRPHGLCAGQFLVPDDFDSPLPEQVLSDFEYT